MKNNHWLVLVWAISIVALGCSKASHAADLYMVVRVSDGDTVVAIGPSGKVKIRLVGIDAPETSRGKSKPGQPYSVASKKYLTKLTLNKKIALVECGKDRYGRVLGQILVDTQDVNLSMVYAGLAEVYRGKSPKCVNIAQLYIAENEARKNEKGMWAQGSEYISPKDWRKGRRSSKIYRIK